jgi:hypothetical protein
MSGDHDGRPSEATYEAVPRVASTEPRIASGDVCSRLQRDRERIRGGGA